MYCTAQGLSLIFYNFIWSIIYTNTKSLCCTPETLVFWSSNVSSWIIGKVPDAGKDWGQKENRVSEDETAGWHHSCNRHELGQISGDGEARAAWRAAVHGSDTTGWLNNNNLLNIYMIYMTSYIYTGSSLIAQQVKNTSVNLLKYSCLFNPMDRGAWRAAVHGVAKESDVTEQLTR